MRPSSANGFGTTMIRPAAGEVSVGVMGLGHLGSAAAQALRGLGFQVQGWSRTPKCIPGVACHSGANGLDSFLAASEILVVLLPHTPATEGMINLALLRKLKRDGALGSAHLINAGRGLLQVDADILAALWTRTCWRVRRSTYSRKSHCHARAPSGSTRG